MAFSFTISKALSHTSIDDVIENVQELDLGTFTVDEKMYERDGEDYKKFWIHCDAWPTHAIARDLRVRLEQNAAKQQRGEQDTSTQTAAKRVQKERGKKPVCAAKAVHRQSEPIATSHSSRDCPRRRQRHLRAAAPAALPGICHGGEHGTKGPIVTGRYEWHDLVLHFQLTV